MRLPRGFSRFVLGLMVGIAAVAAVAAFAFWPRPAPPPPAERFAYAPATAELPRLWQTPDFAYRDQHGTARTAASLRGQPAIVDFLFTQCTSACPMMTSKLVLLQRELTGVPLRFVSFSVDPAHDTPAALARYAESWNAEETRWMLLATDAKALDATLLGYRVTAKATRDPDDPIVHSSVFLLVDGEGWVRGVYESEDPAARARLARDSRTLAAPPAPVAGGATTMASLGCVGCHGNARIAPALEHLYGTEVLLQSGMKLVVDDAYLRRSLVEPAADLVVGYASTMPSYAGLEASVLDALVAELRGPVPEAGVAHPPAAAPASGAVRTKPVPSMHPAPIDAGAVATEPALVVDPVCHMTVRASADGPHATHAGHEVHFCSEMCRDSFVANPAKYTSDAGAP